MCDSIETTLLWSGDEVTFWPLIFECSCRRVLVFIIYCGAHIGYKQTDQFAASILQGFPGPKFGVLVGGTRGGTGGSISTACSTPQLFSIFFLANSHLSKCQIGKLHVHATECIVTSTRRRLLWLEPSLFLPAWSMKTEKWIIYYRWPIWL